MGKMKEKPRGPQTPFAQRVDEGVRAYQQAQHFNNLTMAMQFIGAEVGIAFSTLGSWRRDVVPLDYDIVKRFAQVCVEAAPELGEPWVSALLRDARMAGYRDQALAEIFAQPVPEQRAETTKFGTLPKLPAYYVPRTNVLRQLKTLITRARHTGGWFALLGMTGLGKSTLMTALGNDAAIQQAFAGQVRWFELRQATSELWLCRQIALSLGKALPAEIETNDDAINALRAVLPDAPLLLLMDNVTDPRTVQFLCELGSQIVVVLTTRSLSAVVALQIPESARINITELTSEEAWELVQKFGPIAADDIEMVQKTLAFLAYHPYAIQVTAGAVRVLQMSWGDIYQALRNQAHSQVFAALPPEHQRMWASLSVDWEQLTSAQRYALASLGQLPFFTVYSVATGQAAWNVTEVEATVLWRTLAVLQLVHPISGLMGCYSLHWLVRDFAQQKAHQWSLWERLRFLLWPWRYRLPFRLRWWWPALPKASTRVRWPWWSPRLPGTKGTSGLRPIRTWLTTTAWRRGPEDLRLHTSPQEWVVVTRLSVRMLVAAVLMLYLTVAVFASIALGGLPFVTTLALVITVWIFWVAYADLRRAVLLWAVASSSSFQAASPNVMEEGPA